MGKLKPASRDHIYKENIIEKLFNAVQDSLEHVALIMMVYGGMRVSEVAHCKNTWWDGADIRIPKEQPCNCYDCRNDKKHPGNWQPKSKMGARRIPFRPELRKVITAYFRRYPEIGISRVSLWRRVKGLGKRAGVSRIENIFPHAMRATFITRLLEKEVPDWVVREVVGHEDVSTTSGYAHLSETTVNKKLKDAWEKPNDE